MDGVAAADAARGAWAACAAPLPWGAAAGAGTGSPPVWVRPPFSLSRSRAIAPNASRPTLRSLNRHRHSASGTGVEPAAHAAGDSGAVQGARAGPAGRVAPPERGHARVGIAAGALGRNLW